MGAHGKTDDGSLRKNGGKLNALSRRVAFNIGPLYDETGSLQTRSGIHYSVDAWLAALLRSQNDGAGDNWQVRPFAPLGISKMLHEQGKSGAFAWWPEGAGDIPLDTGGNRNPAPKNPIGFRVWRRLGLIQTERAAQKYDLMHVLTSSYLPLQKFAPKKTLATIWDMTVQTHADTHTPPNRIAWEAYFAWAKAHATGIVTISQAAKAEIVGHLGVAPDRVFVVPLAARANVAQVSDGPERNALLQSVGLPHDAAFVLYGGTLEPRKNLPRLLAAFADVVREMPKEAPLHLVLAGGTWAGHNETLRQIARDAGIADRVLFPGYVSGAVMNALMSACAVFAFPSLVEGFGMPPLEAMTCGAPVIVSNTASLPEVVGDAGVTIDPADTNDLARALHLLLTDANENAARRKASVQRAALFSWDETARQTRRIYDVVGGAA